MFNVRATVGVYKILPDCHPMRSVNDSHCMWLNLNHGWMHTWEQKKCNYSKMQKWQNFKKIT